MPNIEIHGVTSADASARLRTAIIGAFDDAEYRDSLVIIHPHTVVHDLDWRPQQFLRISGRAVTLAKFGADIRRRLAPLKLDLEEIEMRYYQSGEIELPQQRVCAVMD